ncbi:MAG TPA: hypothetical protein ENN39_06270 [Desulfonatronum sp.]|nr:hypothetical protein [Desulfonatronum sp.]
MNNPFTCRSFQALYPQRITTIDSHTAGEPTRLIIGGTGSIPGATMAQKRAFFQNRLDHIRLLLTREPRGHRDMVAAAVTEPVTPGAAFGLIYMDARRYPHLCGHATIGAATAFLETGALQLPQASEEDEYDLDLLVDAPAGCLPVVARVRDRRVISISLTTVPCFAFKTDVGINVPGQLERIRIDLVYAGGFFALVDLDQSALQSVELTHRALVDLGMRIIDLANEQVHVAHPQHLDATSVDVVEFYRHSGGCEGSGLVVYGESHLDRSPCGTGTAAKLALLSHRGCLFPGQEYVNTGPLGTAFTAGIQQTLTVGNFPAVAVRISGSAQITGRHEFVLDEHDPFPQGFLL